jgi:NDP-sugar pyrophosphorylase family protein
LLKAGVIDMEICIITKGLFTHLTEDPSLENLKEEFISNLNSSEITNDKVQACILSDSLYGNENHYYGRINDPRTYQAITHDVIVRKCTPITADSAAINKRITTQPFNKYIGQGVQKQISVKISDSCVIGEGSILGTSAGAA